VNGPEEFLDREHERGVLDHAIGSLEHGMSSTLVLRGEAGVGKTSLINYAIAKASGRYTMVVTGIESEADMSFAGLHRLLIPFSSELGILPGAQHAALTAALGISRERPDAAEKFLIGLAALTVITRVAPRRGLLCIMDDAQWLDRESLEVLSFVCRRLEADRVVMLFGVREPTSLAGLLNGLPDLQVLGLPPYHARKLLASATDNPIADTVATQLLISTGGNPLALTELARELTPEELDGKKPLREPLPIGPRLEARFLKQVHALPSDSQLLLLAAAAEPTSDPDLFWRAVIRLGVSPEGIAAAEQSGLLTLRPQVHFRHPLIRSAIYNGAHPSDRRRVHQTLAEATDPDTDPDRWAWHLASSSIGPSAEVALALEESANRSRRRGGDAAVASVLARSAQLSPDPDDADRRYLAAADEAVRAGELSKAEDLLKRVSSGDPEKRAQALLLQGRARRLGFHPDAGSMLMTAAQAFEELDPARSRESWLAALEAESNIRSDRTGETLRAMAEAALAAPSPAGSGTLTDEFLLALATRLARGYLVAEPLLRRAFNDLRSDEVEPGSIHAWPWIEHVLPSDSWDLLANEPLMRKQIENYRATGSLSALTVALRALAHLETALGRFESAASLYAESADLHMPPGRDALLSELIQLDLLAWRGTVERIPFKIAESIDQVARRGVGMLLNQCHLHLSVFELGHGRYEQAYESAKFVYDNDFLVYGSRVLPELVEAAVRSDRETAAAEAFDRMQERASASRTPLALGLLARCYALVDQGDDAERHYRESIHILTGSGYSPQLGRSHLLYGEWLRRKKRRIEARQELRAAFDLFSLIGAEAFATRARLELGATGETARRRNPSTRLELTPQEAQIARLAGAGATNPEIASQMFLSAATVDYHLRKVYRKLGINSRRQLAGRLSSNS
jgi:DNA-binding CsgD family transcriptional regulator